MKLKPNSNSKPSAAAIKITSRQLIICLVLLNIVTICLLFPIYQRVIITSSHDAPQFVFSHSISPIQPFEPPSTVAVSKVPFLPGEEFALKYSSRYNSHLPSSTWQSPDESCGANPDFFDFFVLPKSQRSRFHEDKIIYDTFFKNLTIPSDTGSASASASVLPRGTYVELGAFDGKEESNSIFFDKCLGWDGLLIEAQPLSFAKVIENRPRAIKLSFSPTCQTDISQNQNNQTASFYNYPLSNNGMEGLAQSYIGKTTIQVPCGSLTPVLLDVFGPNAAISFLSLDVEGAEILVLETLDFNLLRIDVLMIEVQNTFCPTGSCPNVHKVRKTMALTAKYALFTDLVEASDVYVRWGTVAWRRIMALRQEKTIKMMLHQQQPPSPP